MGYGLTIEISGALAAFNRAEMKTERVSYDCITPSAARGILDSVLWHPGLCWKIDRIHVINPIKFTGLRRNEVLGVASIFTYGMQKGLDRMREANVTNYSLSNLDALVEVAAEEGYIKPEDKARLIAFRNNPSDESWMQ